MASRYQDIATHGLPSRAQAGLNEVRPLRTVSFIREGIMRPLLAGLALVAITVLTAAPASAQDGSAPGRRPPAAGQRGPGPAVQRPAVPRQALRPLRRFDTNRDRQISREEFNGPAQRF